MRTGRTGRIRRRRGREITEVIKLSREILMVVKEVVCS